MSEAVGTSWVQTIPGLCSASNRQLFLCLDSAFTDSFVHSQRVRCPMELSAISRINCLSGSLKRMMLQKGSCEIEVYCAYVMKTSSCRCRDRGHALEIKYSPPPELVSGDKKERWYYNH
jgi:hypothetical protein